MEGVSSRILRSPYGFIAFISVYLFVSIAVIYVKNFVAFDPEIQGFTTQNFVSEDFSVRLASISVKENYESLIENEWFRSIKSVSPSDIEKVWSYAGSKILLLGSGSLLWDGGIIAAKSLSGISHEDGARLMFLAYPVFIALIAVIVKFVIFHGRSNSPIYFAILIPIVFEGFSPFPWGSIYGLALVPIAFFARLCSPKPAATTLTIFYGILVVSALWSPINWSIVLLFAVIDILSALFPRQWEIAREFNRRNFVPVSLAILSSHLLLLIVVLVYRVASVRGFFNQFVYMFSKSGGHFSTLTLVALIVSGFLLSKRRDVAKDVGNFYIAATGLLVGTLLANAIGLAYSWALEATVFRIATYYLPLCAAAAYALLLHVDREYKAAEDNENTLYGRNTIGLMTVAALSLFLVVPFVGQMKIDLVRKMDETPPLELSEGGARYFLARNAGEIWTFFREERYREAPLILNLEVPSYSKTRQVELLDREGGD